MRIAILTNSFPPDGRGGAEQVAYTQADGFGVLGQEVRVYAPTAAGAWSSETLHGVEIERFPSQFGRLSEMSVTRRLAYHLFSDGKPRRDVAERISAWKPDALLTHNLTGCGMGTARLVQSRGVRWVHTLHDIQLTDPSGQEGVTWSRTIRARAWRAFWSAWRRGAFGQPDVVVSPTQWLLDWHKRHGFLGRGDPLGRPEQRAVPDGATHPSAFARDVAPTGIIIPNPVTMSAPRERVLRHPATIAYVGRLSRDKGFDAFLDALQRLDASVVGCAVAAGEGPMMEKTRALHDPRLDLRGRLSPEDARRVIAEADLLIAPSRILENQQTILLEAMAEGTPVVASDTGGTKETLEGTGCPVIADSDGQKIAHAIRELPSDALRWTHASRALLERTKRHENEKYFSSLMQQL